MTIGIDLRILAKDAHTGVEEYSKQLLSFLLPLDKSIKYKIFYNAYNKDRLSYKWSQLDNVEVVEYNIPNKFLEISGNFGFPKIDKLLGGVDTFFQPHFLSAPLSQNTRRIITFHDLSFERYPKFFSWRKRLWHQRICPRKQACRADKIIATSESTKSDLATLYKIPSEKIKVIYSGVDNTLFNDDIADGEKAKIREKYNIHGDFILFLGTLEPRKNILGVVKAFEILKGSRGFLDLKLVIAGGCGWLHDNLLNYIKFSKYGKDIIFTGKVDNREKKILYKLAKVFMFPSFFEGFGFPPLEAMASGLPVVTSNVSSLPEVVGDSAIMVDPQKINEIAGAAKALLENDNFRQKMIEKGKERAKNFSWQKCAEETLDYILE